MTSASQFRQFAEECLRSAEDAQTELERKAFLDMARAWTRAALGEGDGDSAARSRDKTAH